MFALNCLKRLTGICNLGPVRWIRLVEIFFILWLIFFYYYYFIFPLCHTRKLFFSKWPKDSKSLVWFRLCKNKSFFYSTCIMFPTACYFWEVTFVLCPLKSCLKLSFENGLLHENAGWVRNACHFHIITLTSFQLLLSNILSPWATTQTN